MIAKNYPPGLAFLHLDPIFLRQRIECVQRPGCKEDSCMRVKESFSCSKLWEPLLEFVFLKLFCSELHTRQRPVAGFVEAVRVLVLSLKHEETGWKEKFLSGVSF